MDVESAHDRLHGRQVFLILRGDLRVVDDIAAVRTGARHRDVVHLFDLRRDRTSALAPIRRPRLPTGPAGVRHAGSFRKWRGLAKARAPRDLERVRQSRNLSAQSIALPLELRDLVAEARHILFALHPVTPKPFVLLPQVLGRFRFVLRALPHAFVMPEFFSRYKSDPVINY